ncbi:MAG TPA: hypothetical protein VL251_09345, partial [Thermomonas sp.]|nr:hypothetical protein [Thermomonas sp.]
MSKLSLAFLLAITVTGCATHPSAAPSPTTRQETNLAVARKLYADFMKGDIDSVLGAMSDDVVWEIAGP